MHRINYEAQEYHRERNGYKEWTFHYLEIGKSRE